jgi:nitrogenase subunit NifH
MIQEAEPKGGTVVEIFPDSELAETYRNVTRKIVNGVSTTLPIPLELHRR